MSGMDVRRTSLRSRASHFNHGSGHHQGLVRRDDTHRNPAGIRGNCAGMDVISRGLQRDPRKAQSSTNPIPDDGVIFPNAPSKDEGVQTAQRGRKSPNPFRHLLAEQSDRLRSPDV